MTFGGSIQVVIDQLWLLLFSSKENTNTTSVGFKAPSGNTDGDLDPDGDLDSPTVYIKSNSQEQEEGEHKPNLPKAKKSNI